MTTLSWKLKEDLCRCCHAEGKFHRLSDPCRFMAQNEVYTEMLKTTLDLEIRPVVGALEASTFTICEPCILRLRDAHNFRQQVLDCEASFRDMYNSFMKENDTPVEIKEELPESYEDVKKEYNQTDDDCHDGFEVKFDDSADDEPLLKKLLIGYTDTKKPKSKIKSKTKKLPKSSKKNEKEVNDKNPSGTVEGEVATVEKKRRGNPLTDEFVTETEGLKRYSCKACKVAYRRLSDLRNHVTRSHLKRKFIKCRQCPETFMYHSQRKEHMYIKHDIPKPDRYVCTHCKREFKRKNTLAEHMMDVHIEKKCKRCVQKFTRKNILRHMNEVHGCPMPTCGICGLKTAKESALVRHQRNVHLNEKNKKCSVCEKRFYTQSNLQDHMITHNQTKEFKCNVCFKSFSRKECYKTHYRIHTGDRPFKCKLCAISFIQRASLRFHMKSHHNKA